MGSFYGGNGISISDAAENKRIKREMQELNNHIIISATQPIVQKEGDFWFVIVPDDDNNNG